MVRGLTGHDDALPDVAGLCISSTVPVVLHELRVMPGAHFARRPLPVVVGFGVKLVCGSMDNPCLRSAAPTVVANAVAAADRWGGPVVVVDLGTAIAFEVLRLLAGQHVGLRSRPRRRHRGGRSGRGERSCVRSRSSGPLP